MVISKGVEYAIRALLYIKQCNGHKKNIDEIFAYTNVPKPLLAKLLQELARKGYILSKKGPGGGFYLNENVTGVKVQDIAQALGSTKNIQMHCILNDFPCGNQHICSFHEKYADCYNSIQAFYTQVVI